MSRRTTRSTRTDTLLPYTTLFRSRTADSTILVEARYAGPDNFTGAPLPGYEANRAFLRREAAAALARVQAALRPAGLGLKVFDRSEEHTSELQSLMRISYAVFCLTKKTQTTTLTEQTSKPTS